MYSDTHFHFLDMNGKLPSVEILRGMAENDCFFAMDIGTLSSDLPERIRAIKCALASLSPEERCKVKKFLHFSAGIWPSEEAISKRAEEFTKLTRAIEKAEREDGIKISAIGECGVDRKWNVDGSLLAGEKELFEMQLTLAKEKGVVAVIHSRNDADATLNSLLRVGNEKIIMHCYSYTLRELESFLKIGYYISLSGNITYAKKKNEEEVAEMVREIPENRLLLESDSPYLPPNPFRGKVNSPLLIRHTYEKVAAIRAISVETLCKIVDENVKNLFSLQVAP